MAKKMLVDTMVAGQEPVIDYIASAAALQQFQEASLAYCVLRRAQTAMDAEAVSVAVEELLENEFQASFCLPLAHDQFNSRTSLGSSATGELVRQMILLKRIAVQVKIRFDAVRALSELERLGLANQSKAGQGYVCAPASAIKKLKERWNLLLLQQS